MKISIMTAILLIVAGTSALAHQDPPPPPSGIVIHLFGPDSGSSHILPTAPAPPAGGVAPASGAVRAPAAASENYPEPSWGDVLHQMFVTGDPDQLPGQALSAGRASKPPAP